MTPLGLRKQRRKAHARVLPAAPASSSVGDAAAAASSAPTPTPAPAVPAGMAPIFAGWNVWDVWQADDPSFDVMTIGESLERQLRVWVENAIKDGAPGAAVADPANPMALRGAQVQPIGHVTDLKIAATRADIPELANASLNSAGATATLHTVRFWSRADNVARYQLATTMPWPHDDDYLLNVVYQPTAQSPVTNSPQPGSLAGTATQVTQAAGSALTTIAIVGGVVLAGVAVIALAAASKKAAA